MAANQQGTALATIGQPRLPYHPAFEQYHEITPSQWKVLTETIFPGAKTPEIIIVAKEYCKSLHLDVMRKPVHIVPIWDSDKKAEVETVWLGIDYLRTIAHRTGGYAGTDETEWGEDETRHFVALDKQGKKVDEFDLTIPQWAQITVYRMVQGHRVAFPGPRVRWIEAYASRKGGAPNSMWRKRTFGQLEKCAEAAALRKAFPEELGEHYIAEEGPGIYQRAPQPHTVQRAVVIDGTPARPDRGTPPPEAEASPPEESKEPPEQTQTEQAQGGDYGYTLANHKGEEVLAGADAKTFMERLTNAVGQYIERGALNALDKLWEVNSEAITAVRAEDSAGVDDLEVRIEKAKEQAAPA